MTNGKSKLRSAFEKTTAGSKKKENYDNKRLKTYYPKRNEKDEAAVLLRFLPGPNDEYFVELLQHGFKENGKYYIENCPVTIDKECPVCEYNKSIVEEYGSWDDVPVDEQDKIKKRGRTAGFDAGYYANILVIHDTNEPENNGKIFLFRFGKTILDMIKERMEDQDDGFGNITPGIDPFDLDNGANFKWRIKKKDGRANYNSSEWEKPSPCPECDLSAQQPLEPIIDEKNFKSYDELKKRFDRVMKLRPQQQTHTIDSSPEFNSEVLPSTGDDVPLPDVKGEENSDPNQENMDYFKNLAKNMDI